MSLSAEQLRQYRDDGFLIVRDLFTETELEPLIEAINEKVDTLAERLFASGKIKDKFENEGFLTRLTKLDQAFPGAAVLIHTGGILPKAFQDVWSSPKLLDIIEQILGPEIVGHPVWNLRSKTPHNPLATVPWHQDTAYLAKGSESTFQPTAWIPLVDADEVNGCMQVIRTVVRGTAGVFRGTAGVFRGTAGVFRRTAGVFRRTAGDGCPTTAEDGRSTRPTTAEDGRSTRPTTAEDGRSTRGAGVSPAVGQVSPPDGQVSPPDGQVSSPDGQVSSPDGQVSSPDGQLSSPDGQLSPSDHPVVYRHKLENTRGNKDSWYLYIDEADLPQGEIVTCTMKQGSVLLLNNLIPHRSTENYSDIIRWSIDLRWQKPGEISGMEGIKEPILMRTARDPNYKPDWDEWAAQSRQVGLHDVLAERDRPISEDDAKVSGPWMARWM